MKKITSFFLLLTFLTTSGFALTVEDLPKVNTADCVQGLQNLDEALGLIGELFPGAAGGFNQSASTHEAWIAEFSTISSEFVILERERTMDTLTTLSQGEREGEVAMAIGAFAMGLTRFNLQELIETCRRGR